MLPTCINYHVFSTLSKGRPVLLPVSVSKEPSPSFNVGGGSPPAFFHSHNLVTLLSPLPFQGSLRFSRVFWSQKRWSQTGKSLDGLAIVIWTSLKPQTWSSYLCHCLTFPVKFCSLSFSSFLWLHWPFREAPVQEKTEPHRAPERLHRQFSIIATEAISGHGETVGFFTCFKGVCRKYHEKVISWWLWQMTQGACWMAVLRFTLFWMECASGSCNTMVWDCRSQSLRPPPSTVSADKEPLDKVQSFGILSTGRYSAI